MTVKMNLSLSECAASLLTKVGSKSQYLSEVTEQRWRVAQHALGWLKDEGWELPALRTAMAALSGVWEQGMGGCDPSQPLRVLRVALDDQEVDERACRAMCLLAAEWWSGNRALRAQLEDAPSRPRPRGRATPPQPRGV